MEKVFALDIGTRVVIGLIMQKIDHGYEIIASARTEHGQRAMYDGQVHDVDEVAWAVAKIKDELEMKTGLKLQKVAVAAAGRALSTQMASAVREEDFPLCWEKPEVLSLEMEAVQNAMAKITSGVEKGYLHCVGYSTVKYQLEDMPIASLVGQKGKKAEVTVVATFLPRTVVDGLLAVLERVNLKLDSLTLEPIAAGQAAIPPDMRRMNLALIDIGAGTADIALTKEGSFFTFGMVPMAGDEVTEVICSHYLLDFQEGENIKKELGQTEQIKFVNFFGEEILISKKEILEIITPTIQTIAEKIGQEILLLNHNTKPQAVILVGGGSLTPELAGLLADVLELPRSRVGIQIRERLAAITGETEAIQGADVITPIGIGIVGLDKKGLHFYSVSVNDVNVHLFDLQKATVAEALLAAGIQPRTFLGRPGAALIYELNGKISTIKGELGKPAQISVNGCPATLDQELKADDAIIFVPGYCGKDAQAKIKAVTEIEATKKIFWNGREEEITAGILMDGVPVTPEEYLRDGCKLLIRGNKTLADLCRAKGLSPETSKKITIKVNGKETELPVAVEITVNGRPATGDYILRNNDRIEVTEQEIKIEDLDLAPEPMMFYVNDEEFLLPPQTKKILYRGRELKPSDTVENGMELKVEGFNGRPILSELFPYLNLTEKAVPGRRLIMSVNGEKAEYTTELNKGDRIVIRWVDNLVHDIG